MAATAATTSSSHLLLSSTRHVAASSQPQILFQRSLFSGGKRSAAGKNHHASGGVRCMAVAADASAEAKPAAARKKSGYELQTLTGWLLRQEQKGEIDTELTIVMSSIAMACKQIASLVQRAGISNLTGVQGAVNIQGEDQKKLDVVSNEVKYYSLIHVFWIFF
ncbi:hypothetical protein DY000_02056143 [Brassica cretica]|uniref:fructose-bisphosphatase n=1 Tax=Brassica cretica TaxID=69181 RepID=A0ABQ7A4X6_BRACR|nr:hypothetical protein DY000_02056143 [Brassica cretica]